MKTGSENEIRTDRRDGIAVAGSLIADVVKTIDRFPAPGQLSTISRVSRSVGGCVSNTASDLAAIDPDLKIAALGKVGRDEYGAFLVEQLRRRNVDVTGIKVSEKTATSFSDVMSIPGGERTFFSFRGANDEFCPADVDVGSLDCRLFHIGYILMLDRFDEPDRAYGTVMARFLHDLQQRGIKTSVDVVSSSRIEEYERTIKPALRYLDYAIINEWECCHTWKISPRRADGTLDEAAVRTAMEKCMEYGVKEKMIVHAKEAGFCLSKDGRFSKVGTVMIPKASIKGSVGAGDAFCAGSLYGIYHGYPDERILSFSAAAAACSLFEENAVDGMRSKDEIEKLAERYGISGI